MAIPLNMACNRIHDHLNSIHHLVLDTESEDFVHNETVILEHIRDIRRIAKMTYKNRLAGVWKYTAHMSEAYLDQDWHQLRAWNRATLSLMIRVLAEPKKNQEGEKTY